MAKSALNTGMVRQNHRARSPDRPAEAAAWGVGAMAVIRQAAAITGQVIGSRANHKPSTATMAATNSTVSYMLVTGTMPVIDARSNSPAIVKRINEMAVVPVPQPIFLYGEGESYRTGLGEDRVKWAYPLRSWMDAGIRVPMSSDCPATSGAELINPLLGIYVAVTRKTDAGFELGPEQKIGVEEALRAYTLNSAYATFEEGLKGSIEVGKLADFAILSDDPTAVPPDNIKDILVEMTIIGGRVIHTRSP